MLMWALAFLVIAILGGVLGFAGVVVVAVEIFWVLCIVGVVMLVTAFVAGRRSRST